MALQARDETRLVAVGMKIAGAGVGFGNYGGVESAQPGD